MERREGQGALAKYGAERRTRGKSPTLNQITQKKNKIMHAGFY
jgi:hypothetical protein